MTPSSGGFAYVREGVFYLGEDRVHLSDGQEYTVPPQGSAVLETVLRGESDFGRLRERLVSLAPDSDPNVIAKALEASLQRPRSILTLAPPVPVETPNIIVCDFAPDPGILDSRKLVRTLRRRHRVLLLGHPEKVRGLATRNLSFEAAESAGFHRSWFRFAQWCRGFIRKHARAVLVLCGQQDAILFGDLVTGRRTLVALDPGWPPRTGASDLIGPGWIPDDPLDAIRSLFYALSRCSPRELGTVNRTAASEFAILEGLALRRAERVVYTSLEQLQPLEALGREPGSMRPGHTHSWRLPAWSGARTASPHLLLVADADGSAENLIPYATSLGAVPQGSRSFGELLVPSPPGWLRVVITRNGGRLVPYEGPPPDASSTLAAILLPGLLGSLAPAWEALAGGFPCLMVSAPAPHPLLEAAPPEMVVDRSEPERLATLLNRLRAPRDPLARRLLTAQRKILRESSVARRISKMVAFPADLQEPIVEAS